MPGVRVDAGVAEGGDVSVHYDPLIAKVIAAGETREVARRRLLTALRSYPILGVRTNVPFLIALLEHPRFVRGELDTRFVDVEREALVAPLAGAPPAAALAVATAAADEPGGRASLEAPGARDPWAELRDWRV